MYRMTHKSRDYFIVVGLFSTALWLVALPLAVEAQDRPRAGRQSNRSATGDQSLADQIRDLQTKVAKLNAALKQNHQATAANAPDMQGGSMRPMGKMRRGMAADQAGTMSEGQAMSGQGMSGMKKGGKGKGGMSMMGKMKGMGSMQVPSALPGFPGASHIYHIGATSFFLDHPQHITLTQQQQTELNGIKEQALLKQSTMDRAIDQAEQELWILTSSDSPDAASIEAKVREIEKLGGGKRIAYIRAVGVAAGVLTDEQRKSLVGTLPPEHAAAGAEPLDQ